VPRVEVQRREVFCLVPCSDDEFPFDGSLCCGGVDCRGSLRLLEGSMLFPGARGGACRGMGASTRCARALIVIVLLGLATQAKGQSIDLEEDVTVDPCMADMYKENCADSCTMEDTCNYHGRCGGITGMCQCFGGWSGAGCNIPDPCVKDMYAEGCTNECSMEDDCTNQGRCLGDGSCMCFAGWEGPSCNTVVTDPCITDMYEEGCTVECSIEGTCNKHGRCRGDGSCTCFAGWEGPSCTIEAPCITDTYLEGCMAECSMASTCNHNGRCWGDGSCKCFPGFSGDDCSVCASGQLNSKPQPPNPEP